MIAIQNDFDKAVVIIQLVAVERIKQGHKPGVTWTVDGTTPEQLLTRHPDKSEYFTVTVDGCIIGAFILTKRKTNAKWNMGIGFRYLAKLCILNEHRGFGYADKILDIIKSICKSGIRLEVRKQGQEGLERLYFRNGFVIKDASKDMHLFEWRRTPS